MKSFRGHKSQDLQSSERHLQKVEIVSSISAQTTPSPTEEASPLPFQQSVQLCPGTDIYGYTSIRALRDDLSVYFQIIHGVPPPPGDITTAGTAIPPPVFGSTGATVAGSTVGATDAATVGSTDSSSGATSIAGIISTTGATATDVLFSTTAGASPTATNPVVRKRTRSHGHRRLQDATVASVNLTEADNTTVWEAATTGIVDNSTDLAETIANVTLVQDEDSNATISLSTVSYGEDTNETITVAEPTIQAETSPGPELSIDFEIEPSIPVQFNVCGGEYDFDSLVDKDPLVLEALTHNPIWIRCAAVDGDGGAGCIFTGGQHHISFNNHGSAVNSTEEQIVHPLTLSGISFRKAALSAISMHDPRGEITFDSCEFSENKGAAMVINGRYSGTHTAYYDYEVDDDAVIDESAPNDNGGVGGNPIINADVYSTEDDLLQQFYEDVNTPAPITANPSPAPNLEPTSEAPVTPYPTTALRIPPMPTSSPAPSVSANLLNPVPEFGRYTGPPTFAPDETETSSTEGSFLLATTSGTGTTVPVDPSTTWSGSLGSTTTTQSTSFSSPGVGTDDFMAGGNSDTGMDDGFRRERAEVEDENRVLEVDNAPKSIIKILSCFFHDNAGSATILMTSHYGEMVANDAGVLEQADDVFNAAAGTRAGGVPMAHSIHMVLEETMFGSETVKRSVIINDGGRLQTSEVMFVNNTADSIIHVESATIAMSQTEFTDNTITGDTGLVEMDNESTLESNENNCDSSGASSAVSSESNADAPVSSRSLQELTSNSDSDTSNEETMPAVASPGAPSSSSCAGIYSDGMCRRFSSSCDEQLGESSVEKIEGCVSTWDELLTVVSERLDDERDFIICPRSTIDIDSSTTKAPVVIDSDYITVKCGRTGSLDDECVIIGGDTQFHIVGSASGIELSGLRMMSSRVASIVASGTKDSTLILKNCELVSHVGESAVLIRGATAGASEGDLDITQLMSTTTEGAMAVEIRNCIFRKNTLTLGTISNIGGTLTVYETLFDGNFAKGGDIVLTNKSSGKVQGSCFDASSSTAPGTVFVEFGASMSVNKDNFGINNTSVGDKCNAIFQESEGTSCLSNPAVCDGSCVEFTSKTCTLPMYDKFIDGPVSSTPASAPVLGENAPPHALGQVTEPNTSNNLIPIVVATLVSAFVVFGLAGIIWHRKKKGKGNNVGGSGGVESEGLTSKISSRFASLKSSNQSQEEELNEAYDGFDDLDEEDMRYGE